MLRLEFYQGSRFAQFLGRGIEFKSPEAQEMRTLAAIHSCTAIRIIIHGSNISLRTMRKLKICGRLAANLFLTRN